MGTTPGKSAGARTVQGCVSAPEPARASRVSPVFAAEKKKKRRGGKEERGNSEIDAIVCVVTNLQHKLLSKISSQAPLHNCPQNRTLPAVGIPGLIMKKKRKVQKKRCAAIFLSAVHSSSKDFLRLKSNPHTSLGLVLIDPWSHSGGGLTAWHVLILPAVRREKVSSTNKSFG